VKQDRLLCSQAISISRRWRHVVDLPTILPLLHHSVDYTSSPSAFLTKYSDSNRFTTSIPSRLEMVTRQKSFYLFNNNMPSSRDHQGASHYPFPLTHIIGFLYFISSAVAAGILSYFIYYLRQDNVSVPLQLIFVRPEHFLRCSKDCADPACFNMPLCSKIFDQF
jgi:hypothetical protein